MVTMNKKTIINVLTFFGVLNVCLISFASEYSKERREYQCLSDFILTKDGTPTKALLDILNYSNIESDGTLKNIVEITQQKWIRALGKERWHMNELNFDKKRMLNLLEEINCGNELTPKNNNYDYLIILGGIATGVKLRLDYMIHLWNSGIRFNKVILLAGERKLDPVIESKKVLDELLLENQIPADEIELMECLYANAIWSTSLTDIPVEIVKSKAYINLDGSVTRPTTGDTVKEWLKNVPDKELTGKSCLAISIVPFIGYQDSVLRTFLPASLSLETVGPKSNKEEIIAVHLDNLARWLYQEQIRRNIVR